MKKILLTIGSVLLAANFAMAQATEAQENESQSKSTPGEPATMGGSINAPLATPVSSWRNKMKFQAYYGV